jgi:tetratricopeptide (TPR) repeat protein
MSTPDLLRSCLEAGLQAHNQGNIEAAKAAYQRALALAPDHPDALHLLGVALLQLGQPEQAVDYLARAARKLRDNPAVAGNLAQAYFAAGRYAQSHETFRKASRLDPRNVQFQLGVATSIAMQGKHGDAENLLRRLTARFPQEPLAWFNLGNALRDQGRTAEALESYRKATELDPHLLAARNNLAGALHALLRFEEAEFEHRACIRLAPDYVLARCNLASVLIDLGRFAEAEAPCHEAIRLAPGFGQAHTFLGAALGHQGRMLEALECHRTAAELAPHDARVAQTYATTLADTGHYSEGLRWFSRSLALNPGLPSTHQLLGHALLGAGRLAEGWAEYGYRPSHVSFREKYPHVALPRMLPSDLNGKHICVMREQGLGDEIFFLRYVPQLHAAGARITYCATNKIRSLLARVASIGQVLEETMPPAAADAVILAGDLPHALSHYPACPLPPIDAIATRAPRRDFSGRISVFWPPVPPPLALSPLAERCADMRQRLAEIGSPPYLGLTWRGGTPPREQRAVIWMLYKQIGIQPLAAALQDIPGTFIALQRNPEAGEIAALSAALGRQVHDFTALNEDLEGLLALLALIDEYIGVSNTNMHLRASIGKTARVLVPCPADWRWLQAGRSSPWFPGFTIYRQSLQGDWDAALTALKQDLAQTCR